MDIFTKVSIRINTVTGSEWENIMQQAIKDSGLSYRELERLSGISAAQISRFMSDDPAHARTLTIPTAEKIAEHIGVEIQVKGVKHGKSK